MYMQGAGNVRIAYDIAQYASLCTLQQPQGRRTTAPNSNGRIVPLVDFCVLFVLMSGWFVADNYFKCLPFQSYNSIYVSSSQGSNHELHTVLQGQPNVQFCFLGAPVYWFVRVCCLSPWKRPSRFQRGVLDDRTKYQ